MAAELALHNAPEHVKALALVVAQALAPAFGELNAGIKQVCDIAKRPDRVMLEVDPATGTMVPGVCHSYARQIQQVTAEMCSGVVRDECDLMALDQAANASAYPLIKKHLNRREMSFVPTGAVGTGLNAEGLATIFVASGAIAPGRSMLFEQDPRYPLSWRLGCLEAEFTWSDGTDSANYKHIRITIWVANKNGTFNQVALDPIGEFGEKWNDWQKITGKDLYCNDCTKPAPIDGPTGCPGLDPVGREARLLIQLDNLATAAESINSATLTVEVAGFKKPCCDTCKIGGSCACGH
jgi:hypothetical protein